MRVHRTTFSGAHAPPIGYHSHPAAATSRSPRKPHVITKMAPDELAPLVLVISAVITKMTPASKKPGAGHQASAALVAYA